MLIVKPDSNGTHEKQNDKIGYNKTPHVQLRICVYRHTVQPRETSPGPSLHGWY